MALWDFRQDPGGLKTEEILSGQPYPSWRKAEVPGDIAMACPEQPYYEGICWYRREFEVPSGMKGKRIMLHFEAVNHISCIYINSIFAGRNNQGYLPFGMDISKYVTDGNNTLLVMVDNGIMEVVFKDGWISKIMTRSGPLPCDAVAPGSLRFVETVPSKDFLPGWETINESVYTVTGWKMIENGPVRWVCRAEGHVGNAECISNITIHKGTATIDFDINLDCHAADGYFRADFPVDKNPDIYAGIPFGMERRDLSTEEYFRYEPGISHYNDMERGVEGLYYAYEWTSFQLGGGPFSIISDNCSLYYLHDNKNDMISIVFHRMIPLP